MARRRFTSIIIAVLVLILSQNSYAEELSPFEILKKSFEVYGGKDSVSRLTFSFYEKGALSRKTIQKRVWKNYSGKDGLNSKVILFSEFPPDTQGVAFMTWSYNPSAKKKDGQWIYLPVLRKVREMSESSDEDFPGSELKSFDLIPRYPALDENKLLKTENMNGKPHYVIESKPKWKSKDYPYSKVIKWVSKDTFLLNRIDSYDKKGNLNKQQNMKWKKVDNAWVWEEVEASNVQNGNKTVLTITDIKVDVGLKDNVFSKRTLKRGYND